MDPHKRLAAAKNPNDRTRLQEQIDATDREIDRLVCDLYGLTEEDIAIVEACGEPFDKTQDMPGRPTAAVASEPSA